MRSTAILADIGGTNARFALMRDGRVLARRLLKVDDFASIEAAVAAYLVEQRGASAPVRMAVAAAGPVSGGEIRMTNSPWRISADALRDAFRFKDVILINDFAAVAWAVPHLTGGDTVAVGGGRAVRGAPVAVLGPGTGLGVAGLIPGPGGDQVLVTEGGHVTMSPADSRENLLLEHIRARVGHVSAERVLSGDGLVNLARAIGAREGAAMEAKIEALTAAEITEAGLAGTDPTCVAALATFCAMLGTVAGNLALTLGARGGVYIAGGIVPRFVEHLAASAFRARFEDKGRFAGYLAAIPTRVIVRKDLAFVGLRAVLNRRGKD